MGSGGDAGNDGGIDSGMDGGVDASGQGGTSGAGDDGIVLGGACSCRAAGSETKTPIALLSIGALLIALGRRRRTRS